MNKQAKQTKRKGKVGMITVGCVCLVVCLSSSHGWPALVLLLFGLSSFWANLQKSYSSNSTSINRS